MESPKSLSVRSEEEKEALRRRIQEATALLSDSCKRLNTLEGREGNDPEYVVVRFEDLRDEGFELFSSEQELMESARRFKYWDKNSHVGPMPDRYPCWVKKNYRTENPDVDLAVIYGVEP